MTILFGRLPNYIRNCYGCEWFDGGWAIGVERGFGSGMGDYGYLMPGLGSGGGREVQYI